MQHQSLPMIMAAVLLTCDYWEIMRGDDKGFNVFLHQVPWWCPWWYPSPNTSQHHGLHKGPRFEPFRHMPVIPRTSIFRLKIVQLGVEYMFSSLLLLTECQWSMFGCFFFARASHRVGPAFSKPWMGQSWEISVGWKLGGWLVLHYQRWGVVCPCSTATRHGMFL